MASHPTPLKLLALGLHSYFVYYWGKQLLGDPSEARPDRGVGLMEAASPQKLHAKGVKIIEAFRNERRQKLQKVRGSAQMGQIAGKFADLGPIGSRVGVLRDLVRRYSGADAAAMRDQRHVAQVGALTEAVREVVAQRCKPADEKKGTGGWCTPEKDWKAEVKALYHWYRANVRYTRDPLYVDTFSAPDRTLGTKAGDCLPAGTLLLTKDRGYQPIELIREGDEVQGDGVWTKVTRWWDKGTLPTLTFKLNNGSVLTCTAEHKLFRVPRGGGTAERREQVAEVRAGDVRPGDELLALKASSVGVESVAQGDERQVYDIETDTHRFYLPETDLIVHNCDDGAVVMGTLLTLIGCNIRFRVIQTKDAQTWSHIYLMVDVDANGKQWLPLDVTMSNGFPWQAPGAAECARDGRPAGIVTRVRDFPL